MKNRTVYWWFMEIFLFRAWELERPYKGGLAWNTSQKELALALPFPDSKRPDGYLGFAVNMINLSPDDLNITTGHGYGLRETLFYSLFGKLQVYKTRKDMFQAMPYLKDGAVSLDGGVIKGKGKLLLGSSEPKITFPVVAPSPDLDASEASLDVIEKMRQIDAKTNLLAEIEKRIIEEQKDCEELNEKLNKKKRKFDEISDSIQPSSALLAGCSQVQTPGRRFQSQTPQKLVWKQEPDVDTGAFSC